MSASFFSINRLLYVVESFIVHQFGDIISCCEAFRIVLSFMLVNACYQIGGHARVEYRMMGIRHDVNSASFFHRLVISNSVTSKDE